jgi:AcrR family transcriptional regulator
MFNSQAPEPTGKEKILLAAFQLFLTKGYDGASLSDLLKVSGMAKGTFYHHFSSKEQLYQSVLEKYFFRAFEDQEHQQDQLNQENQENVIQGLFPELTLDKLSQSQILFAHLCCGYLILMEEIQRITPDMALYYRFLMEAAHKLPELRHVVSGHWSQAIEALASQLSKEYGLPLTKASQRARELTGIIEGLGLINCITGIPVSYNNENRSPKNLHTEEKTEPIEGTLDVSSNLRQQLVQVITSSPLFNLD